jgi:hypothetical protein
VGVERVVADKGYHSQPVLEELAAVGVRTVIAEQQRQRRRWAGQRAAPAAVYANRRRLRTARGQALMRRRGTQIERSFAHLYGTGGLRRVHLRGQDHIAKRLLLHAAAFNLSLILRRLLGMGTARQAADRLAALCFGFWRLLHAAQCGLLVVAPGRFTARAAHPPRRRHRSLYRQELVLSTGCLSRPIRLDQAVQPCPFGGSPRALCSTALPTRFAIGSGTGPTRRRSQQHPATGLRGERAMVL